METTSHYYRESRMNDLHAQLQRVNNYQQHCLLDLQAVKYREQLLQSPGKYEDPKCLNRYESEILSQCGEDGIILASLGLLLTQVRSARRALEEVLRT